MSRISALIVGVVLGAGGLYGALNYHIVRTAAGLEAVPKESATLAETYVDVRQFGAGDWLEHRELAKAIVDAGKQDLIKDTTVDNLLEGVREAVADFGQEER